MLLQRIHSGWTKQRGVYLLLILLQLPAVWYAARTPFALIDDYNSWFILRSLSTLEGARHWIAQEFLRFGQGRFRPAFELYNYVTWGIFGTNYTLHHLMRLLLKLLVVFLGYKTISLFRRSPVEEIDLPFLVFASVYAFFPNNPEARLAPTELLQVLSLSMLMYGIGRMLTQRGGDLLRASAAEYVALLLAFTFVLWSKEPGLAFGAVTLFLLLSLNRGVKGLVPLLPFVVVLAHTVLKAYAHGRSGGYGTAPFSLERLLVNAWRYTEDLLLLRSSRLFPVLLLAPVVAYLLQALRDVRRTKDDPLAEAMSPLRIRNSLLQDPALTFCLFVMLSFLAFFAISLAFSHPVIRYFYPSVFLLALLVALSVGSLRAVSVARRRDTLSVVSLCMYFVLVNYYNFVYQFAAQYAARTTEQRMLAAVTQLHREGQMVYFVISEGERTVQVQNYYQGYLPFFHRDTFREIRFVGEEDLFDEGIHYVAWNAPDPMPGHVLQAVYGPASESDLLLLRLSKTVSALLQFRSSPFAWVDAGVERVGSENWYVYATPSQGDYP